MLKENGDTAAQSGKTAISVEGIIADIERRVQDKILEPSNAELLKKLIRQADSLNEAISIAELGTTYNRTGFYFDKRLESTTDTINYFKENKALSFTTDPNLKTHKLIIGDNYPALLNLLIEYRGKIDVIYIDPPYAADSMGKFAKTNYENAITRDNLLSMLYPRLVLARQLLSESGVIFCSIDDRNQAYVKGLFDEVFEEKNFVANINWKGRGGRQDSMYYAAVQEYIICYAKCSEYFVAGEDIKSGDIYPKYDEVKKQHYKTQLLRKWGSNSRREDRPNLYYPILAPDGSEVYPKVSEEILGCWRWGTSTMEQAIKDGRVEFVKQTDNSWIAYEKIFAPMDGEEKTKKYTTWIDDIANGTEALKTIFEGKAPFAFPKSSELITRLLKMAGVETEATILDFFAGSGTTGQAVLELNKQDGGNRQFILCTNNEITDTTPNGIALDVTTKRLKRVMTGQCYDGTNNFKWLEKNKPLGDNLQVLDIAQVADFEDVAGKTPFDVIDETLYGKEKFKTLKEKIEWVIDNFELTQKQIGATTGWLKEQGVK